MDTRTLWRDRVLEIHGSNRSQDGCVTIEADVTGRITSLHIADFAMDDGPDRLIETLLACHSRAVASALRQVEEHVHADLHQRPVASAPPHQPDREDVEALAAEIARINDATDRASGGAYSGDSAVFLEVTTTGQIASAWLADHAGDRGGDRLADSILESYARAREAALTEGERIYREMRSRIHRTGQGGPR